MDQDPNIHVPWTLDPVLIGTLAAVGVVYWLLAGPLRSRLTKDGRVSKGQAFMFASALLIAFLAEASPLHDLSERYLFSAHMFQHLVLSYAVAPLMLAAIPSWMARPFIANRIVLPVARVVTLPLVAFLVFNVATSLWHVPFIYEAALVDSFVHHVQHLIFLALAFVLWWPVMSNVPEVPRMEPGGQIFYLLAMPLGQFFVAAILTFSAQSIYPMYEQAPRIIPGMSAAADQQLGGVIMKTVGFVAFGIPLAVIFLRWLGGANSGYGSGRASERTSAGKASPGASTGPGATSPR